MEDEEIVNELKQGNVQALYNFIDKYGRLIYKIINDVLNKKHEKPSVDECFDDVILDIWYNINSYNASKGKLVNWFTSVCKFNVIDYKRRLNKLYATSNIDDVKLEDKSRVENHILMNEYMEFIKGCINKMNMEDKSILTMRYFEGYGVNKIAEVLGISNENVYSKLSRGRKKLKKIVLEGGEIIG